MWSISNCFASQLFCPEHCVTGPELLTGTGTETKAGPEIWRDRDQGPGPGLVQDRDHDWDRDRVRERDHDKEWDKYLL